MANPLRKTMVYLGLADEEYDDVAPEQAAAQAPAPVPSGARIRTHAVISEVTEVAGGLQVCARVTAEAEGGERPVCVAEVRIRYLR